MKKIYAPCWIEIKKIVSDVITSSGLDELGKNDTIFDFGDFSNN